jgi:glycine cleavage system H protein
MVAIFVALMFVGFVLADLVVQKWEARRRAESAALAADAISQSAWLRIPAGVYLAEGHAWARPQRDGTVRTGADALISRAVGEVSRVRLPRVGDEVVAGEPLFDLESDGRTLTVVSPVSGKVAAVNAALETQPGLLVQNAFDEGWVCAISPSSPVQANGLLRHGASAKAWFEQEVERFSEFVFENLFARLAPDTTLGLTAQDGGVPRAGVLAGCDGETWQAFAREFLRPGKGL